MSRSPSDRTRLIRSATRKPSEGRRPVNPPIERASTLLNPGAATLRDPSLGPVYGIDGMTVQHELRALIAELEGAADAWLTPTGLAAITIPILALTRPGDTVVATDAVYGPSRRFLDRHLSARGVTTRYHPADAATDQIIAALDGAKLLLIESPASLTFEMIDVPAVAAAARDRGVLTVMDNTWAAGLAFRPLAHGVDVSVQAVSKYAAGHSDLLMGAIAVADARLGKAIFNTIEDMGWHTAPDEAWLALRGLRTLPLRMAEHARSALQVAQWLQNRPEVARVLYPPLPGSVGHDLWTRDYAGAAGLMGVVLRGGTEAEAEAVLDALTLFGLGYSWGGFESLATHETPQLPIRRHAPALEGPLIRLHVGLEDPADLIADLEQALKAWAVRSSPA
ncbi:cystathionine beta-lyase [Brevundimonas sp.]|uniref:cystathionine beta-lyase n=1 Tax=Brevundimonas sp. TaxID=1871086 RepID=UPI001DFEA0D7|nr:cystathionine beta-lyase [Brevundimonas sp.]MBA3999299.1 cystathionine beta-lyase [Brevundimonas sp.]